MSLWIVSALVVALGVLVFIKVRAPSESRAPQRKVASPGSRSGGGAAPAAAKKGKGNEIVDTFRGAALFPQKNACEAIVKLRGKTFPEGRTPKIPVPGCDRETCECQVHEIVGRRRGARRISSDRRTDVRFKEDRRKGRDRREGSPTWVD